MTCNLLKAREKSRVRGPTGFGFACHLLKNWLKIYEPLTKRGNCNRVITFNRHLKTALLRFNIAFTTISTNLLPVRLCCTRFPALSRGFKCSSARVLIGLLQQTFERLASQIQIRYQRNPAEIFSDNFSLVIFFPFQVLLLVSSSTVRIVFVLPTKLSDQHLGIRRQAYTSHPPQKKRHRT